MAVLEFVIAPYKHDLPKDHVEAVWKEVTAFLVSAPGCLAIYGGLVTTHPALLGTYVIWDSLASHHNFQHSEVYAKLGATAAPILTGDLDIKHFEITDAENLKKALESNFTQTSVLQIKKGTAHKFLKDYYAAFDKYVAGEKYHGWWTAHSVENPFLFAAFLGWDSEQDHYDVMKKENYQRFRESFKDYVTDIVIYHVELKKEYGQW